jgi:hypothetical protein
MEEAVVVACLSAGGLGFSSSDDRLRMLEGLVPVVSTEAVGLGGPDELLVKEGGLLVVPVLALLLTGGGLARRNNPPMMPLPRGPPVVPFWFMACASTAAAAAAAIISSSYTASVEIFVFSAATICASASLISTATCSFIFWFINSSARRAASRASSRVLRSVFMVRSGVSEGAGRTPDDEPGMVDAIPTFMARFFFFLGRLLSTVAPPKDTPKPTGEKFDVAVVAVAAIVAGTVISKRLPVTGSGAGVAGSDKNEKALETFEGASVDATGDASSVCSMAGAVGIPVMKLNAEPPADTVASC